jgi:hypothetical protein
MTRNGFFLWILNEVMKTEVQTPASVLEKEWLTTTMSIIFAFNIIMWFFQIFSSCMAFNARSHTVFIVVAYIFCDSVFEFLGHLFDGMSLLNKLPPDQLVFDSLFIHYMRLIILFIVWALIGMIIISCCGMVILRSWRRQN